MADRKINPLFQWEDGLEDEVYLDTLGFDQEWAFVEAGDPGVPALGEEDEASWKWLYEEWRPVCPAGYTEVKRLIWEDMAQALFVKPKTLFAEALLAFSQTWATDGKPPIALLQDVCMTVARMLDARWEDPRSGAEKAIIGTLFQAVERTGGKVDLLRPAPEDSLYGLVQLGYRLSAYAATIDWEGGRNNKDWLRGLRELIEEYQQHTQPFVQAYSMRIGDDYLDRVLGDESPAGDGPESRYIIKHDPEKEGVPGELSPDQRARALIADQIIPLENWSDTNISQDDQETIRDLLDVYIAGVMRHLGITRG